MPSMRRCVFTLPRHALYFCSGIYAVDFINSQNFLDFFVQFQPKILLLSKRETEIHLNLDIWSLK